MKITILGTGAYGIALALMFHENKNEITMWTPFEEEKEKIVKEGRHEKVLPGIAIPSDITFTTDIKDAIEGKELLVLAIPVPFINGVIQKIEPYATSHQHFLIASKGIEQGTGLFVHQILSKYIHTDYIAALSGPTFAIDMASLVPCGLSLASKNPKTTTLVKNAIENQYLKVQLIEDILGVEICGAIKNVLAIASGMIEGMHLPITTKALFITKAVQDLKKLLIELGGQPETVLSLAGIGDLLLTCTSPKSRNFTLGMYIGEGKSKEDVQTYISSTTVEGLSTLKSISDLIEQKGIKMPIISILDDIISYKKGKEILLEYLLEKE
ncbi:MAG: NAD(P)H-dependent glycerol-3-phosphate dehydrogenase [Bacilli bacterium]|nr:NAD(P)H-dependent glycerol-3-phosphate dehydrogenase [Bacilli bacterium]